MQPDVGYRGAKRRRAAAMASVLVIAAILLATTSCTWPGTAAPREKVRVASPALEQAALIYLADEQGFFQRNGLDVVIEDHDSGVSALNALLQGKADLAETAEYPFVGLAMRGEPVKVVATNDQFENDYLVARPESGIKSLADLRGKRVGLARGTIVEFYLARLLELHGLGMQDITLVDVRPNRFVSAIAGGEVDALIAWQPYVSRIEEQISGAVVLPAQSGQGVFGVLAAQSQWIREHPAALERFLRSLAQAQDYLRRHPAEAQAAVSKRLKYDPAYLADVWPKHNFALSMDQPLIIAMKDEAEWMVRSKQTEARALPDFADYVYTTAMEAAQPGSVSIVP
jgi:aliphatic sulfonates family ABC transporter substrate-binding protein